MLSEGYLCKIPYHELLNYTLYGTETEEAIHELKSLNGVTYESTDNMQSRSLFCNYRSMDTFMISVSSKKPKNNKQKKDTLKQTIQYPIFERQTSEPVEICVGSSISKDTYLVPSSCKSICKNYNDLHIAGDQVLPMNSIKRDAIYDSGICPFLESSEIPLAIDSIPILPVEVPRKPSQRNSSCCIMASIMHHQQPLSNSILNNYLEEKVLELYKQYIMDVMGSSISPTQILTSEFIMTNVDQISMKLSQEMNMKTTEAKDMVINCLLQLASGKVSSEMSTPSLHISQFSTK
ncbi:CXorf21: Chromosome X orf 21 [Crotalus adamanteus]|uniref:CXorf21: Chromosome X orf 21 n=2 Tax=Crotalus TaxID=8728 RepID=A0AAW1BIN5_CROAD|nr:TLR adapter interacting with SLC15A4 on the lysosome isoform X2 [Crotalus tigris]XP_039185561.1 TLR adapter interacting with SLC15A4 on the lysosome isoform X2 [Crotalus tigris]